MQGVPVQTGAGHIDYSLGGMFQNSSYADASIRYMQVENGLVQGDHKKPNPIKFYRYESNVSDFVYTRTDSGFPTQSWAGRCRSEQSTQTAGLFDSADPMDSFSGLVYPDLMNEAVGKIYAELRGNNEVIVDAAEGASTIRMFKSAAALHKGVAGILETIVGIDKRGRSRGQVSLDSFTSKWLEYRYGWMPLIYSVYDAIDNLHREQLGTVREITGKAKSLRKDSYNGKVLSFSGSQGQIYTPLSRISEDSRRARVTMRFVAPDAGIWDWTSLNPASISWELLPLSFVADWFFTVGDSLRNLENYLLWKTSFLDGYVTYTYKGRRYGKILGQGTASLVSPVVTITRDCAEDRTAIGKNRIVLTELPVPIGPRFKVNLNSKRLLDTTALFHVMVGSKLRKVLPAAEFKRSGFSTRGQVRRALGQISQQL